MDNGKVKAVGANLTIPPAATVIDLGSSTVLPGLFDPHTHLCMTVNMKRDAGGIVNARSMLAAGFTTVRDVGNEGNYACTSVRRAVSRGLVQGPTIINAGRIIAPYGGQFQLQPSKGEVYSIDDLRFVVAEAAKSGLKVAAHVWTRAGAHNAAAGVAPTRFTIFPVTRGARWQLPGWTAMSPRDSLRRPL